MMKLFLCTWLIVTVARFNPVWAEGEFTQTGSLLIVPLLVYSNIPSVDTIRRHCDVPGSPCLSKKHESNVWFVSFKNFYV